MAELDFDKLDTKTKVALTRRGRSTDSGLSASPGAGSGMGLGMSGAISSAANQAASTNLIPVANPQVMRGMKLDPRGVGGQTFAELQEKVSEGERPVEKGRDPGDTRDMNYEGYDTRGAQPGDYIGRGGAPAGGGELANQTMGRILGSTVGKGLAQGALASVLGAPGKQVTNMIGSGFTSLTGIGAINELAGAVVGSEIGTAQFKGATDDFGKSLEGTEVGARALEKARQAATGRFGLVGMGLRGLGSLLGLNDSPFESAQEAIDTETRRSELEKAAISTGQPYNEQSEMSGFDKLKSSISNAVPNALNYIGLQDPTKDGTANFNFETLKTGDQSGAGDKGVLDKNSSQQKAIRERTAVEKRLSGMSSGGRGNNQGYSYSGGQPGMTDTYDIDYGGTTNRGGWGDNSTSEGGFSGSGGGDYGGGSMAG
jgi:hypothetical protein